jgi:serine/threonine-protein kinase
MAPEQARGQFDTLDERVDVFGLGAILCEILTGQPPYAGPAGDELYCKAERAELAESLARLDACGAEGGLVALAKSCLAAMPKDRPRDAGAVTAALTAHLAGVQERLKAAELAQAQAESRAAEECKRRVLAVGLAASLLAVVALGVGGGTWVARDRAARAEATTHEVTTAFHAASLLYKVLDAMREALARGAGAAYSRNEARDRNHAHEPAILAGPDPPQGELRRRAGASL